MSTICPDRGDIKTWPYWIC